MQMFFTPDGFEFLRRGWGQAKAGLAGNNRVVIRQRVGLQHALTGRLLLLPLPPWFLPTEFGRAGCGRPKRYAWRVPPGRQLRCPESVCPEAPGHRSGPKPCAARTHPESV